MEAATIDPDIAKQATAAAIAPPFAEDRRSCLRSCLHGDQLAVGRMLGLGLLIDAGVQHQAAHRLRGGHLHALAVGNAVDGDDVVALKRTNVPGIAGRICIGDVVGGDVEGTVVRVQRAGHHLQS